MSKLSDERIGYVPVLSVCNKRIALHPAPVLFDRLARAAEHARLAAMSEQLDADKHRDHRLAQYLAGYKHGAY